MSKVKSGKLWLSVAVLCVGFQPSDQPLPTASQKPNVLFIVVDDLRTELGCYGNQLVKSPNIDQLAQSGVVFDRAYVQYPVCGPSRCSFLTGLRPSRTRFTSNAAMVDREVPEYSTLPEHFKNNGYHTISNGKIFHDHGNVMDGMDGWSEVPWRSHPAFWVWQAPENQQYTYKGYQYRKEYQQNPGPSHEAADVPDDAYPSGKLTRKTLYDLRRLKEMDVPFFLAVGFWKPHLPHNAPKKYWDLYRREQFELPENFNAVERIPEKAFHNSRELRVYNDIPEQGEIEEATWRELMHGYYACVSYIDTQIGKLLDELEKLKLRDNTMIVLLGDHGYQLSNHGMWSKATNFHDAVHAPLIVSMPKMVEGQHSKELVEFVDIFPSLADLCGLSIPDHLPGRSFAPIIRNVPDAYRPKPAVFSRVGEGETMITQQYIYTEWMNDQGQAYENMLFALDEDPFELNNLAKSPKHQKIVTKLSSRLHTELKDTYGELSFPK